MTQEHFPYLHSALDAPEFLKLFRSTMRSGVLETSEVSAGTSGSLLSVAAGKVIIDGTYISDDAVKLDGINLGHTFGTDGHYIVYQTYTYTASDPPSASLFAAAGAVPPTQPILPAGAVKLSDIFIPAAAVSILSAGVRIVNVPKLATRDDTGELIDRLVMSVGNSMLFSAGSITYDDGTGFLNFSQTVYVQALVTTNRQKFDTGPSLVRGTLAAGAYAVPGTTPTRDTIVYTLIDRSAPNDAQVLTLKFLDRVAPASAELTELLNPLNETKIVILGMVFGTRLFMPGIQGQIPTPDADTRKFLNNDPGGIHTWDLVNDDIIVGAAKSVANTAARNAITADMRKEGSLVYVQDIRKYFALVGGILDANWVERTFDQPTFGVSSGCAVTNPSANTIQVAAGEFYTPTGKKIVLQAAVTINVTAVNRMVVWDDSLGVLTLKDAGKAEFEDMPFAFASYDGVDLTRFIVLRATWPGARATGDAILVGDLDAQCHFKDLSVAARWLSAFDGDSTTTGVVPRVLRVISDIVLPSLTSMGTVDVSAGGVCTGTGTRFKRDLAVGDLVRITGANYLVSVVTSDVSFTVTGWSAGAQVAQALSRCDHASSYAPNIDLSSPEFSQTILLNVKFRGPEWTAGDRPVVFWGASTYACTVPMLNWNGQEGLNIEDLDWSGSGAFGRVNHDNVWLKKPGKSWHMARCRVTGGASGRSLTHYVNLGSSIGGDDDTIGADLEDCVFKGLNGVGTSPIYVSANINGVLNAQRCQWSGIGLDTDFLFESGVVTHSLDVKMDDVDISGIRCGLFLDAQDFTSTAKILKHSRLGAKAGGGVTAGFHVAVSKTKADNIRSSGTVTLSAPVDGVVTLTALASMEVADEGRVITIASAVNGANNGTFPIRRFVSANSVEIINAAAIAEAVVAASCAVVGTSVDGQRVTLDDCVFHEHVHFLGTHTAIACRAVNDTGHTSLLMTLNTSGAFDMCDFAAATVVASGGQDNEALGRMTAAGVIEWQKDPSALLDLHTVQHLSAIGGGGDFGVKNVGIDAVVGIYGGLWPSSTGGGTALATLLGSCMRFANGMLGTSNTAAPQTVNVRTVTDMATGAVAASDTVLFFYARVNTAVPNGLNINGLFYSSMPPQADGTPNAGDTLPSGVAGDYRYVGCLETGTVGVTTTNWKHCRVAHDGLHSSVRRTWIASPSSLASEKVSVTYTAAAPATTTLNLDLNSRFPTARKFGIAYVIVATQPSVSGIETISVLTEQNVQIDAVSQFGGISDKAVLIEECPRKSGTYDGDVTTSISGGGTINANATMFVAWMEEDLNDLAPFPQNNGN